MTNRRQTTKQPHTPSLSTLMARMETLAHLLAKDVEHIRQGKFKALQRTLKDKLRLADDIEQEKQRIVSLPNYKERYSEEERHAFVRIAETYHSTLKEHHRHLTLAREANAIVVRAIRDSFEETVRNNRYGERGDDRSTISSTSMSYNAVV